jgi:U3 small nucleolar RNA-associated protein 14
MEFKCCKTRVKTNTKIKLQVSDLPFPFRSVKEFEASIRAPIGRTWVPETAHRQLSAPKIVTHAGQKIEPMSEDALVQTETLKINNKKKVKAGK